MQVKGKLKFPNRTTRVEMNFQINNLRFKTPGLYHFEFWIEDELIGQRDFKVSKI